MALSLGCYSLSAPDDPHLMATLFFWFEFDRVCYVRIQCELSSSLAVVSYWLSWLKRTYMSEMDRVACVKCTFFYHRFLQRAASSRTYSQFFVSDKRMCGVWNIYPWKLLMFFDDYQISSSSYWNLRRSRRLSQPKHARAMIVGQLPDEPRHCDAENYWLCKDHCLSFGRSVCVLDNSKHFWFIYFYSTTRTSWGCGWDTHTDPHAIILYIKDVPFRLGTIWFLVAFLLSLAFLCWSLFRTVCLATMLPTRDAIYSLNNSAYTHVSNTAIGHVLPRRHMTCAYSLGKETRARDEGKKKKKYNERRAVASKQAS